MLEEEDATLAAEAMFQHKGYQSYILKPIPTVRRGTKMEIENMCRHIRKGCYSYPLPPREMSICINPEDEYSDLIRIASTSQGESANKEINRLGADIARQGAERAHERIWLRVHRFNIDKDGRLQKVLKIEEPRTLRWYLHEALFEENPQVFAPLYRTM